MSHIRMLFLGLFVLSCPSLAQRIHGPRGGHVTFPQNVQDTKFSTIYWPSTGSDPVPEAGKEYVFMREEDGEKFLCILPSQDNLTDPGEAEAKGKLEERMSRRNPEKLLDALNTLPCFYRSEGWWSYELCYKKHLRQFHAEPDQVTDEFYLGVFDKDETKEKQQQQASQQLQQQPDATQRYHSHFYTNGTTCDLTGTSRRTEVKYICGEGQNLIASIQEGPTCHYEVVFQTDILCQHKAFKKQKPPTMYINCHAFPRDPNEVSADSQESGDVPLSHTIEEGSSDHEDI